MSMSRVMPTCAFVLLLGVCVRAQDSTTASKIRRAQELAENGKPEEAIPIYRELSAAFPAVPSFAINLAIAEYRAGRYRDAIAQCRAVLKIRPDLFSAWLFIGASQLELGETASAIEPLEKAVALQPDDDGARIVLGGAFLTLGRHKDAATQFQEATRVAPGSSRAWYGLVRCYEPLALEAFQALDRAEPEAAELLALAGYFEVEQGQPARAFARFRQALEKDSTLRGIHLAIAAIYEDTGHTDWALVERAREPKPASCDDASPACNFMHERFREAASSEPAPGYLYWRARAFLELERQAYQKLQELPAAPEKYQAAAMRYEKRGLHGEAASAWKQALDLAPGNPDFERHLSINLCRSNNCAAALPVLRVLLDREPSSAELNYLYGTALEGLQQHADAARYFETALKINGSFLVARAALGEAYLGLGDAARAVPQLEAASASDDDGTRHYQLARAYQTAGSPEKAAAALRTYREILKRREAEEGSEPRITPP